MAREFYKIEAKVSDDAVEELAFTCLEANNFKINVRYCNALADEILDAVGKHKNKLFEGWITADFLCRYAFSKNTQGQINPSAILEEAESFFKRAEYFSAKQILEQLVNGPDRTPPVVNLLAKSYLRKIRRKSISNCR